MVLGGLVFGGIVTGYMNSAMRAEWAAYHLAAQALANQRLEAARAAKWDTQAAIPTDALVASNFPPLVEVLDIPTAGTNVVFATNRLAITIVSANPPLKMIRSETAWSFYSRGVFTNYTLTYRAPDQ